MVVDYNEISALGDDEERDSVETYFSPHPSSGRRHHQSRHRTRRPECPHSGEVRETLRDIRILECCRLQGTRHF